ncbi:MAG: 2-oxoglutarate dehydrogenase E1 component, partial [Terriglobales bacterium]
LLRSQGLLRPRRPLIVMTPKSLLRHPAVASPLTALASGGFEPLLGEAQLPPESVTRVALCSGKIYYDLLKARTAQTAPATALVRLEQLYPFPAEALARELARWPQAQQWSWVQEEPENMGAWTFLAPRLQALLPPAAALAHVARRPASSPATGSLRRHQQEQAALISSALAQ